MLVFAVRSPHLYRSSIAALQSLLTGPDKMAMRGLIIANKEYKDEELINLPKVANDSKMMNEMLRRHGYEVTLYEDVIDIGAKLEEFKKEVAKEEIERLHFHFSGNGAKTQGFLSISMI